MGKNRREINVKGVGYFAYREIDPTPTTSFTLIGFLADSSLDDSYDMIESRDDAGNYIDTKEAGQKPMFISNLLQSSKSVIDFMKDAKAKYFETYYKVQLNDLNWQEYLFPVCRIIPGVKMDFKPSERRIPLQVAVLWPAVALTRTPSGFNTAIGEYYKLVEGASPIGEPTDAATVPQAAI